MMMLRSALWPVESFLTGVKGNNHVNLAAVVEEFLGPSRPFSVTRSRNFQDHRRRLWTRSCEWACRSPWKSPLTISLTSVYLQLVAYMLFRFARYRIVGRIFLKRGFKAVKHVAAYDVKLEGLDRLNLFEVLVVRDVVRREPSHQGLPG